MAQATRNSLGTSLITFLIGLHFGFFAGHYRHLWFWEKILSDYEVKHTVLAVLTVAFLAAEALVSILSKKRYRRHSGLLLLGAAQLYVFFTSFEIYKDFVGVFLGIPSIVLYAFLATSAKAQVFTVESGAQTVLPTFIAPSPVMQAQPAPPAYSAAMPIKN